MKLILSTAAIIVAGTFAANAAQPSKLDGISVAKSTVVQREIGEAPRGANNERLGDRQRGRR